jgi:hypothetical protein
MHAPVHTIPVGTAFTVTTATVTVWQASKQCRYAPVTVAQISTSVLHLLKVAGVMLADHEPPRVVQSVVGVIETDRLPAKFAVTVVLIQPLKSALPVSVFKLPGT